VEEKRVQKKPHVGGESNRREIKGMFPVGRAVRTFGGRSEEGVKVGDPGFREHNKEKKEPSFGTRLSAPGNDGKKSYV